MNGLVSIQHVCLVTTLRLHEFFRLFFDFVFFFWLSNDFLSKLIVLLVSTTVNKSCVLSVRMVETDTLGGGGLDFVLNHLN